jgi:hypothetical protein
MLPPPPDASMAAAAGLMLASAADVCCWKVINSDFRESSSRPKVTQAARRPAFSF